MENLEQLNEVIENKLSKETDVLQDIQVTEQGSKGEPAESPLGKFKDASSLYTAYTNLQSDYTRKCQALSSLQKQIKDNDEKTSLSNENVSDEKILEKEKLNELDKETLLQEYIFNNEELKNKILAKYFDEINLPKSPKLIGSDRSSKFVLSPKEKPKTMEQAEILVREMFDNN